MAALESAESPQLCVWGAGLPPCRPGRVILILTKAWHDAKLMQFAHRFQNCICFVSCHRELSSLVVIVSCVVVVVGGHSGPIWAIRLSNSINIDICYIFK